MNRKRTFEIIRKLKDFGTGQPDMVRHLPAWVEECRVLAERNGIWMYVETTPARADAGAEQFVLDLPPGRYMVEIFDTLSGTWISRESAAGGPLVAGLPRTGNPQVVRIVKRRNS